MLLAVTDEVVWTGGIVGWVELRIVEVGKMVDALPAAVDVDAVVLVGFTGDVEFGGKVLVVGLGATAVDVTFVGLRGRQAPAYGRVMVYCGSEWRWRYQSRYIIVVRYIL